MRLRWLKETLRWIFEQPAFWKCTSLSWMRPQKSAGAKKLTESPSDWFQILQWSISQSHPSWGQSSPEPHWPWRGLECMGQSWTFSGVVWWWLRWSGRRRGKAKRELPLRRIQWSLLKAGLIWTEVTCGRTRFSGPKSGNIIKLISFKIDKFVG